MSWKNVRDHYQVQHTVRVREAGICIGSPYIPDIIIIGLDGVVKKRYKDGATNEDLRRIQDAFDADPGKLKELVLSPDSFDKAITVYTYDGGNILEKKCEELGWPNVTHDGQMMYENTFSDDKAKVVEWAKDCADRRIRDTRESVEEAERRLAECKDRQTKAEADRAKLEKDYPTQEKHHA